MKFNKNDIEYYLLTKEYSTLSTKELGFVKEVIPTEEEYNSMRQLVLAMEEFSLEEELIPRPEIKKHLVTVFEKARFEKGINTKKETKIVPIQKEKETKKRGIFWFSIAASIILLVGLFFYREYLFLPENDQLAMLDDKKITTQKEITAEKENIVDEETNNKTESTIELEEKEPLEKEDTKTVVNKRTENSVLHKAEISPKQQSVTSPQLDLNTVIEKEVLAEDDFIESEEIASAEEPSSPNLSDKNVISMKVTTLVASNDIANSKSRSLEDDKELIDLFYTAL